jgi:hypothetical protein
MNAAETESPLRQNPMQIGFEHAFKPSITMYISELEILLLFPDETDKNRQCIDNKVRKESEVDIIF